MKKLTTSVLMLVLSSSFVALNAQEKKDSIKTQELDEVRIVGYRKTTKRSNVSSVATLSNEVIENKANSNALNAVQGRVSGVHIAAGSGQPGSNPTVVIRGAGSFSGSTSPLYVIDGLPSTSEAFAALNPNDFESMDVLKDAAAIAEYGNRGANGVVVVTTKKGRFGGKVSYRYSNTTGISILQDNDYNYANSSQLLTLEKRRGVGLGVTLTDDEIRNYAIDTNWRKEFFRPALTTTHNFSVTTGGRNSNIYTSVGYTDQEGILKTTGMKRFTLRNNVTGRSENRRFKYNLVTGIGYTKNNLASSLGTAGVNQNFVLGAYKAAPYIDPNLYTSGQGVLDLYQQSGTLLYTPLMLMDKMRNYKFNNDYLRLDLVSDLTYEIIPELEARVRTSAQYLGNRGLSSTFPWSFNALAFQGNKKFAGQETMSSSRDFTFNNLWQATYKKQIEDHTFTLTGNAEYTNIYYHALSFTQNGLDPKTFVPGAGTGYVKDGEDNDDYVPEISGGELRYDMISYFGSFEYDFDKKYGVTALFRRDGSSAFAPGKKWGNFWSVGGRWNIDREDFMSGVNFVDYLKFRGSYGVVGNANVLGGSLLNLGNPPRYKDVYGISDNVYNGLQGYGISFGYDELKWEPTTQYNLGFDFTLFKRLSGTVDYYNKKTNDLFFPEPQSPAFGTTNINVNSDAYIVNKGFEAELKYDLIKKSDLQLSLWASGSMNNQSIDGIKSNGGEYRSGNYISVNGGLVNEFFLYRYVGVNKSNGNLLFLDKDGNPTETPTEDDRVRTGYSYLPKYQGGFGFNFDYKGFFTSAAFSFVADVYRFDFDLSGIYDPTDLGQFNVSADLLDAWTPDNTNTNIPSLTAGNYGYQSDSDRFLRDASYLRLRNVQIGYRLPKSLLRGTFVDSASLNVQAENLVTFSKWRGFDPESSRSGDQNQYPTPRIISIGFDVKF